MHVTALLLSITVLLSAPNLGSGSPPTKAPTSMGRLHLTFAERSPLSSLDTVLPWSNPRRPFDKPTDAERTSLAYDLTKESFEAFIPSAYSSDTPWGLFVWIGAGSADVPPGWLDVFRRDKLIWISPNNTGNRRYVPIRMGLALDAVHNMKKLYHIDENRVYVSGFSGGAGVASFLLHGFPNVFRGGYLLMGYLFYDGRRNDLGQWEAGILTPPWQGSLDQIKKNVRLVILNGEGDPGVWPGARRVDAETLRLDGFERVGFLEVPRLGHRLPDAVWFEKGIAALEESPPPASIVGPTKEHHPLPGQIAQAQRILTTARVYLEQKPSARLSEDVRDKQCRSNQDKARQYLHRVLEEYPTTPAAARARELLQRMGQ